MARLAARTMEDSAINLNRFCLSLRWLLSPFVQYSFSSSLSSFRWVWLHLLPLLPARASCWVRTMRWDRPQKLFFSLGNRSTSETSIFHIHSLLVQLHSTLTLSLCENRVQSLNERTLDLNDDDDDGDDKWFAGYVWKFIVFSQFLIQPLLPCICLIAVEVVQTFPSPL